MEKRGKPFEKGNKFGRGRPRGSRNKRGLSARQLLDSHAEAVMQKALDLALEGDSAITRVLLSHLLPRPSDQPVKTGPLPMATAEELAQTSTAVLDLLAKSQITTSQARDIFAMIDARRKFLETEELHARLRAMEQRLPEASA